MQRQLLFALAASATFVCQCVGGPHLGMKLAVKEFGDAWKTGNRNLIAASVTPDFRFALFELSQDEFAKLWSPNSGNLVRTAKHGGWGTIYLSTARGPVEVTVRGSGFDWAVSDVRSPDQTGVMTSFRDVVQVTAAAQTFVRSLRDSDSSKARTVSSSMLSDALESGEWAEFTSAVKRQKVKPTLLIRGDTATI